MNQPNRAAVLAIVLAAMVLRGLVQPVMAAGQTPLATAGDSAQRASRKLFTMRDVYVGGAFAITTVALFPLDKRIATELQEPDAQANRFFKNASTGVEVIASPGAYVIGGSLYLVGRFAHMPRIRDLGWHGSEAVLLADAMTDVIKMTAGRSRPFVSNATNPRSWSFGGGLRSGNQQSFPSGHTATAFAAASSVSTEVGVWWPHKKWLVRTVMYGGAAMVGGSRMYHNRHWASDVALGSLIGTFSGWKVVQYTHDHPANRFDRIMLGTTIIPQKDRVMIGWSSAGMGGPEPRR